MHTCTHTHTHTRCAHNYNLTPNRTNLKYIYKESHADAHMHTLKHAHMNAGKEEHGKGGGAEG